MARESLKNVLNLIDSATNEVAPQQDFLNDLKRSIELDSQKNPHIPSKTYKPSGMNCMRASYYTITGAIQDEDKSNYVGIGICATGSEMHERIQKAVAGMKDNNMDCEYVDVASYVESRGLDYLDIVSKQGMETKLYHKDLNMSFLCDGIIRYKGKYYILELKTETSNKFWSRNDVDPSHYKQATAYSVSLGIDEVIFVYISRDNSEMKSFMLKVLPSMKEELFNYIATCDNYIANMEVPPIPDPEPKKSCQYCVYKTQCRKDS